MKPEPFAMERLQSIWEHRVGLMSQQLGYPQTDGTVELRNSIAVGEILDGVETGRTKQPAHAR